MMGQFGQSSMEQFMERTREWQKQRQTQMEYAHWLEHKNATVPKFNHPAKYHFTRPKTEWPQLYATIEKIWEDFNVQQDNQKGVNIHVAFSVSMSQYPLVGVYGVDIPSFSERKGLVTAYFYDENGSPLKDLNGKYCHSGGNVCLCDVFQLSATAFNFRQSYSDFVLFMPYNELHVGPGIHRLNFEIVIISDLESAIARSQYIPITYSEPLVMNR